MPQPPLSEFTDDSTLAGEVLLLRRIPSSSIEENEKGEKAISSAVFQLHTAAKAEELGYPGRCMSLALESAVIELGGSLRALLQGPWADGYALARLEATDFRELGFGLQRVPEETDPWHVVAFPLPGLSGNKIRKAQPVLAEKAVLVPAEDLDSSAAS